MAENKNPTEAAQDALRSSLDMARRLANDSMEAGSDAAKKIQEAFESVAKRGEKAADDSRKAAQDAMATCVDVAKRIANESMETGTDAAKDVQGALDDAVRVIRARVRPEGEAANVSSSKAYEDWTKDQLYDRASQLDITGRSDMNKKQLIAALRDAS